MSVHYIKQDYKYVHKINIHMLLIATSQAMSDLIKPCISDYGQVIKCLATAFLRKTEITDAIVTGGYVFCV